MQQQVYCRRLLNLAAPVCPHTPLCLPTGVLASQGWQFVPAIMPNMQSTLPAAGPASSHTAAAAAAAGSTAATAEQGHQPAAAGTR